MDYKKYIVICFMFIFSNASFADWAFEITNIEETGYDSVKVDYSKPIDKNVEGDYYLIEDLEIVEKTVRDYNNKNKLIVTLNDDLEADKNYILLSIVWAEGNISFTLPEDFRGLELMNESVLSFDSQGIEYIKVVDSQNLEIFYTSEISKDVSIKMIKNIYSSSSSFVWDESVSLSFDEDLLSFSEYTLAVWWDIASTEWDLLMLSDSIKPFTVWDLSRFDEPVEIPEEPIVEDSNNEENIIEDIANEENIENDADNEPVKQEEPKAVVEEKIEEEPKDVVEVAHNDWTHLPNSWPKETALILLAMLLWILFTFKNQLIKQ